ncbi:MAG: 3-deoxy-manno-octulosonate cytidylyltransferase [Alphaproteobacteria bacterium]|nr:3-deoxy-manno-octulosonate cytidylyltransferase [Alphaproteobacteria bacterium]
MTAPHRPVVLIPSRLQASRLPGKPLADINGSPMIVHVWRRAVECDLGPVVVACAQEEIADAVRSAGGEAVLTDPDLLTGSDRIHAALGIIDPESLHDAVVNIQGDLPVLDPHTVRAALALLETEGVDIGTVAAEITREEERDSPSVVKAVVAWQQDGRRGRALYFSRAEVPTGEGPLFHHIGLYAYRRTALERFVGLPRGVLERREMLEQLRALEAGMRIDVARVDSVPLGVDIPADLERARQLLADPGASPD